MLRRIKQRVLVQIFENQYVRKTFFMCFSVFEKKKKTNKVAGIPKQMWKSRHCRRKLAIKYRMSLFMW